MSADIPSQFADQIQEAYFVWFTSVRADGAPQPTPVWFVRDGDTFLIYSMPSAQKVRNIQQNPKVALSLAGDDEGEVFVDVMGDARIDASAPLAHQMPAYLTKYAEGIKGLDMTPESMAQTYSTAIRVTPTRVRGQ